MVFADAYVEAGVVLGTALALDDVAGFSELTTEDFYTESFSLLITALILKTHPVFMCHSVFLSFLRVRQND